MKPTTLLMRLAGPMQSYGTYRAGNVLRDTALEPSKSAVLGIACCAMGKPRREEPGDGFPLLSELAAMRMAVRVEREGKLREDYQVAGHEGGVATAARGKVDQGTSYRQYLEDACFLVGLEGPAGITERVSKALREPWWTLRLGRRGYAPSVPISLPDGGIRRATLEETLASEPWPEWLRRPDEARYVVDVLPGQGNDRRSDVPIDYESRRFGMRIVREYYAATSAAKPTKEEEAENARASQQG